jgi:hypothetical protein
VRWTTSGGRQNLSIVPTLGSLTVGKPSAAAHVAGGIPLNDEVWAVSQAAPLRRIHIKSSPLTLSGPECANANAYSPKRKNPLIRTCPTTLRLFDVGWASGGFMADTKIEGLVETGTQQQWFSRNCSWTQWNSANWNMVFLGSSPVPAGQWAGTLASDGAITDGGKTPIVHEKPFWTIDRKDRYFVTVPHLRRESMGVDWEGATLPENEISIDDFISSNLKCPGLKLLSMRLRSMLNYGRANTYSLRRASSISTALSK